MHFKKKLGFMTFFYDFGCLIFSKFFRENFIRIPSQRNEFSKFRNS